MTTLGTRKFYKSFNNSTDTSGHQILKNTGYISILLHSAYYNSKGNFLQNTFGFGGVDRIALTSSISYKNGAETIEAKSIQDKREVKARSNQTLGLSRTVALKVPANGDGLELKIALTAIKKDNFENAIDLMNSEEFQQPLQLAAIPVGQILSVTKVVTKVLNGIEQNKHLEATFAGVISANEVANPIDKERLCRGYLIMIANNDEDSDFLTDLDGRLLKVEKDGLKYKGKQVTHTNLVYSITFDAARGPNQKANWFKKYEAALMKLDDLLFATNEAGKKRILDDSIKMWIEASALLYNDPSYISEERKQIKASFFERINAKYNKHTRRQDEFGLISKFIEVPETLDFVPIPKSLDAAEIMSAIKGESDNYMKELGKLEIEIPTAIRSIL